MGFTRMEVRLPVGITNSNKVPVGEQGLVYRRHAIFRFTTGSGTMIYMIGDIHELSEAASGDMVNVDLPELVPRSALALVGFGKASRSRLAFSLRARGPKRIHQIIHEMCLLWGSYSAQ